MTEEHEWWQRGVIYQIYPRSFQDGNGDGVGDLAGIRSRLDYFCWLGVDAIWLSPINPSPMADFGYDVSDYCDIDPIFGTLQEFDELLQEAHGRGLKVLMDLVPNHTSDQHPWFVESRSSRNNPRRDWYIWRDPRPDGSVPNNWVSVFGGSAWQFDEQTGQYYYHAFLKEQPDLNWRNPAVREAMLETMRFWLRRGVDGFRVDVIWHLIKDDLFRDNPTNSNHHSGQTSHHKHQALYTTDRPEVHPIIVEMRKVVDAFPQRLLIGEIYLPVDRLVTYYGSPGAEETHLPFNFQLLLLPWDARVIDEAIRNYEAALPAHGWPNWVLGNHDRPRVASRVGGEDQARVAAMLLLTLRGTPTIYYGEEIGMADVAIPAERVQDPRENGDPGFGRDPCRTPMQWDASAGAGFSPPDSTQESWLPLAEDHCTRNVEMQSNDPGSILSFYRRLLELRRTEEVLQVGDFVPLPAEGHILAYMRIQPERGYVQKDSRCERSESLSERTPVSPPQEKQVGVVLNLGPEPTTYTLPKPLRSGRIVLTTHTDRVGEVISGSLSLRGNEGVILEYVDTGE